MAIIRTHATGARKRAASAPDPLEEQHARLKAEQAQGADPEDPDEDRALNIFWVPQEPR